MQIWLKMAQTRIKSGHPEMAVLAKTGVNRKVFVASRTALQRPWSASRTADPQSG
jgi:hypothetical protein